MTFDDRLRAPDHVVWQLAELVDELAGLDRPHPARAPLHPAQRAERVRARAREVADRVWGEAYVAGGAWGMSINPAPVQLVVEPGHALTIDGKRIGAERSPDGAE
jgi:hypothetical protein